MPVRRRRIRNRFRMDQGFGQPFTLNRDSLQADGLVGWWPALGGGGDVLRDLSGYGDRGTLEATAEIITDSGRGKAISLNGSTDYVSVPDSSQLNITDVLTLSAWVNGNLSKATWQNFCMKGGNPPRQYALRPNKGTGKVEFYIYDSSNTQHSVLSTSTVPDWTWHHVVGVYDGANLKIYIDGILDNSVSGSYTIQTSTQILAMGRLGAISAEYYEGSLDDVRIYHRALTASEVYQMYAPQTRWDLYKPLPRVFYMYTGGLLIPVAMASYRRRRIT